VSDSASPAAVEFRRAHETADEPCFSMRDAVALYGREVTLLSQMRAVALLSLDGQLNLATFRAYTSQQSIDI
jgi:hypothetical protein